MIVYVVNETVDLGSHILKIFDSEHVAEKFAEEENIKLDKKYWDGYSDDLWGGKKIFVTKHTVEEK